MLSQIRKTIALLEPMVEKLKTKPTVKSIHAIGTQEESPHVEVRTEEKNMEHVYRIDSHLVKSGKRWNNNFKYLCSVDSHSHDLYQCGVFMGMIPKERHDKLKGRICRTCLKP